MKFAFTPTLEQVKESNIYSFMTKHNVSNLTELSSKAEEDPDWFWSAVSDDIGIVWDKKYSKVSDDSKGKPWTRWFVGGKTNIISSTVDKYSKKIPNKIAYHFLSENGVQSSLTYQQLQSLVNKTANGLKSLGIKKGDVVAIYMPMIKQAIIAILACAKIGAIQTVIFSGYSSESLQLRINDCNAKALFVSDGFQRKGKPISQKSVVDDIIEKTKIKNMIIVPYLGINKYQYTERVVDYDDLISNQTENCQTEIMESDDPLFILYTSGTTGNPKGVLHGHGGFSVFAGHQSAYLIDTHQNDTLFWPADIGWITGLVWNVYGLLEMGASAVIYDGAIDYPNYNRIWEIIAEYKATIFGISPTAVRMFRKSNLNPLENHNLSTLRCIPTTGEPIDEESWWWLFDKVGNKKIPIMNLSGGTEIGGAMLSVFPGMNLKPTTVGIPCPGITLDVFDDAGKSIQNKKGYLVVKSSWPGMTLGLLNDSQRYLKTYWSRFENVWFHGDYVLVGEDGLWYMHGRVDDVINISGHRMSTAEIEQVLISHEKISDAAAIPIPDAITGEAIVAFVVLEDKNLRNIEVEIMQFVSDKIGKVARPKKVVILSDLPKTRTGKIMRRLLKAKLLGKPLGDLSSLENPQVLDQVLRL